MATARRRPGLSGAGRAGRAARMCERTPCEPESMLSARKQCWCAGQPVAFARGCAPRRTGRCKWSGQRSSERAPGAARGEAGSGTSPGWQAPSRGDHPRHGLADRRAAHGRWVRGRRHRTDAGVHRLDVHRHLRTWRRAGVHGADRGVLPLAHRLGCGRRQRRPHSGDNIGCTDPWRQGRRRHRDIGRGSRGRPRGRRQRHGRVRLLRRRRPGRRKRWWNGHPYWGCCLRRWGRWVRPSPEPFRRAPASPTRSVRGQGTAWGFSQDPPSFTPSPRTPLPGYYQHRSPHLPS